MTRQTRGVVCQKPVVDWLDTSLSLMLFSYYLSIYP